MLRDEQHSVVCCLKMSVCGEHTCVDASSLAIVIMEDMRGYLGGLKPTKFLCLFGRNEHHTLSH